MRKLFIGMFWKIAALSGYQPVLRPVVEIGIRRAYQEMRQRGFSLEEIHRQVVRMFCEKPRSPWGFYVVQRTSEETVRHILGWHRWHLSRAIGYWGMRRSARVIRDVSQQVCQELSAA